MNKQDKNYNVTVIALWETKTNKETTMSMPIDAQAFDRIQDAISKVELGGKFIVKRIKEESRQKFKNPDKAPTHFLEYISAADVEAFEAARRNAVI
jgi:hypothetical protein